MWDSGLAVLLGRDNEMILGGGQMNYFSMNKFVACAFAAGVLMFSMGVGQAAWAIDSPIGAIGLSPEISAELASSLEPKARNGDADAQFLLGYAYATGMGVPQSYTKALYWSKKAAQQDHAEAQFNVGAAYAAGRGVKQSYTNAVQWFRKAAEQGVAMAQFNMGRLYANGKGIKKSYVKAMYWYRKASEQGLAKAQFNLGTMYARGLGVTQNYTQALQLFKKAAEQGYAKAQFSVGSLYLHGIGTTRNFDKALRSYRKAAEQGSEKASVLAQYALGIIYAKGKGVQRDYVITAKWHIVASANGSKKAAQSVQYLKEKLVTAGQFAKAQRQASEFMKAHQMDTKALNWLERIDVTAEQRVFEKVIAQEVGPSILHTDERDYVGHPIGAATVAEYSGTPTRFFGGISIRVGTAAERALLHWGIFLEGQPEDEVMSFAEMKAMIGERDVPLARDYSEDELERLIADYDRRKRVEKYSVNGFAALIGGVIGGGVLTGLPWFFVVTGLRCIARAGSRGMISGCFYGWSYFIAGAIVATLVSGAVFLVSPDGFIWNLIDLIIAPIGISIVITGLAYARSDQ